MGAAPDWLLGFLIGTFTPKWMAGMVSKYEKAKLDGKL
jgi:hypothetical protein